MFYATTNMKVCVNNCQDFSPKCAAINAALFKIYFPHLFGVLAVVRLFNMFMIFKLVAARTCSGFT